jgi:hypothetical protein
MARGFAEIFAALKNADVEFIVVGGVAAVLQGAPITTLDLYIVQHTTIYCRTPSPSKWNACRSSSYPFPGSSKSRRS